MQMSLPMRARRLGAVNHNLIMVDRWARITLTLKQDLHNYSFVVPEVCQSFQDKVHAS